jgi:hypothetical protein
MGNYYTYAYLREDKTPYYIGKGKGRRIKKRCRGDVCPPGDPSRIIFLKVNLTEEEAFHHEIYLIAVYGRKDLGTGILRNKTYGGDGSSGAVRSLETRLKMSQNSRSSEPEVRQRMSAGRQNLYAEGYVHNWTGKHHKPEAIEKCRVTKLGEQNPSFGKHWWVDPTKTLEVMDYKPPDPSWTRGRKKR